MQLTGKLLRPADLENSEGPKTGARGSQETFLAAQFTADGERSGSSLC